jgi:hypothetical protein
LSVSEIKVLAQQGSYLAPAKSRFCAARFLFGASEIKVLRNKVLMSNELINRCNQQQNH